MRRIALTLVCLALIAGCGGPAQRMTRGDGPPDLRVGILVGVTSVQLSGQGPITLSDKKGVLWAGSGDDAVRVESTPDNKLRVSSGGSVIAEGGGPYWVRPDNPFDVVEIGGRPYPGHVEVRRGAAKGLNAVNVVDAETYLRSVIPGEIAHAGPYGNAARAQAVAARTYALANLGKYPEEGFDLYAGVQDQVYGSIEKRHPEADEAVWDTRGQVLTHHHHLIEAKYASTCGGKTAAYEESFNAEAAYLKSHSDRVDGKDACRASRYYRWEVHYSGDELWRLLEKTIPSITGRSLNGIRIEDIEVAERGESGRVVELVVKTDRDSYSISKGDIRKLLLRQDGGTLRSTFFDLKVQRKNDRVTGVDLTGRGWGHGVGMCQWGAMQLSTEGYTYDGILDHYYPEADLEDLY